MQSVCNSVVSLQIHYPPESAANTQQTNRPKHKQTVAVCIPSHRIFYSRFHRPPTVRRRPMMMAHRVTPARDAQIHVCGRPIGGPRMRDADQRQTGHGRLWLFAPRVHCCLPHHIMSCNAIYHIMYHRTVRTDTYGIHVVIHARYIHACIPSQLSCITVYHLAYHRTVRTAKSSDTLTLRATRK